eukprot:2971703-Alexandrium_andersonii.AAC.1
MAHQDLPLGPLLERQHQGAGQPLELPHRILDGTVGLRFVRRPRPEHGLYSEPPGYGTAQVDQIRLVVGLEQDPLVVSEPPDARHRLVHRVVAQAVLAQHGVRRDGLGFP